MLQVLVFDLYLVTFFIDCTKCRLSNSLFTCYLDIPIILVYVLKVHSSCIGCRFSSSSSSHLLVKTYLNHDLANGLQII